MKFRISLVVILTVVATATEAQSFLKVLGKAVEGKVKSEITEKIKAIEQATNERPQQRGRLLVGASRWRRRLGMAPLY